MWYDFFLGKTFHPWQQREQDQAVVDLKLHMMSLEKDRSAYDVKGIDIALTELGFHVDAARVERIWSGLKQSKGVDVGHAMEALAEEITDHVAFDHRRAILSQLWPVSRQKEIPDEKEEAIFDRVASLLGFEDKNFLDSCVKHRLQREWSLSESEMYCVVAELLICMMLADGKQRLQENRHLCHVIAHGFQMDEPVIRSMLAGIEEIELKYASEDQTQADSAKKGLERFERERRAKIALLIKITQLSREDVEHKFHVLIDVPQLDQKNIKRRVKLLVEKLRYSLDDYGYDRLLEELQDIASVDGERAFAENSMFSEIEALLKGLDGNVRD